MDCANPECPDSRSSGSPGEYRAGVQMSVGIRHFVRNEGTRDLIGTMRFSPGGYNPLIGAPVLMVQRDRAREARDLLAEIEQAGG